MFCESVAIDNANNSMRTGLCGKDMCVLYVMPDISAFVCVVTWVERRVTCWPAIGIVTPAEQQVAVHGFCSECWNRSKEWNTAVKKYINVHISRNYKECVLIRLKYRQELFCQSTILTAVCSCMTGKTLVKVREHWRSKEKHWAFLTKH